MYITERFNNPEPKTCFILYKNLEWAKQIYDWLVNKFDGEIQSLQEYCSKPLILLTNNDRYYFSDINNKALRGYRPNDVYLEYDSFNQEDFDRIKIDFPNIQFFRYLVTPEDFYQDNIIDIKYWDKIKNNNLKQITKIAYDFGVNVRTPNGGYRNTVDVLLDLVIAFRKAENGY